MAADNKSLGKFVLDGIPTAPRGIPQVEVTFDIDANGILHVTAKDKATGRSQHITITASSGLSESEVEKMRQDAETHADSDRKRKELIEARNQADNTAYAAEKALKEHAGKLSAEITAEIETRVADLRAKSGVEDIAEIEAATRLLSEALQKAAATVSSQNAGDRDAGPEVVEGEVNG
jgi:molecular chaperone DnaK